MLKSPTVAKQMRARIRFVLIRGIRSPRCALISDNLHGPPCGLLLMRHPSLILLIVTLLLGLIWWGLRSPEGPLDLNPTGPTKGPTGAEQPSAEAEVEAGREVTEFRDLSVSGRCVDAVNLEPVAAVRIELRLERFAGGAVWVPQPEPVTSQTDAAGRFRATVRR